MAVCFGHRQKQLSHFTRGIEDFVGHSIRDLQSQRFCLKFAYAFERPPHSRHP